MPLDFTFGFAGTKSYAENIREHPVQAGVTIAEEGLLLKFVDNGDGTVAVAPTTGDATDFIATVDRSRVAGFAVMDSIGILTNTAVETFNVPAGAPFTVQLQNGNIVNGGLATAQIHLRNNTGAVDLVIVAGAPAAGQASVSVAGVVTFNAAEASDSITARYKYNLTAAEIQERFHERSINNRAQDFFDSVGVLKLEGEIFTTLYDATQAYAVMQVINSGAGGLVTNQAGGAYVGFVSQVPSADNQAMLGIKFTKTA